MSTWQEWEMSAEWCSESVCPDCGHSLIITGVITTLFTPEMYLSEQGTTSYIYNSICPNCRKQYTVTSNETLTINEEATHQQDRIDALEARVARLEELIQKLMDEQQYSTRTTHHEPDREASTPEQTATIRERYKFLF